MTPIKKGEKKNVKKEARKVAFLEVFEASACNVSVSCKKVGISRNTFYDWKKKDLAFAESVREQEEGLLDFAETMLYKAIKEGKTPELIFFLKTKGKRRGYIERSEMDLSSGEEPIKISLNIKGKEI